MLQRKLIKKIEHKYVNIHIESWKYGEGESDLMVSVYSKNGFYLGSVEDYMRLYDTFKICEDFTPYNTNKKDSTICCGYSPLNNKYYGWSHRAIRGFTVGSSIKRGDIGYRPDNFQEYKCNHNGENCYYLEYDNKTCTTNTSGICCEDDCIYPLGRGEWTASSLQEAKIMSLDYAEDIS